MSSPNNDGGLVILPEITYDFKTSNNDDAAASSSTTSGSDSNNDNLDDSDLSAAIGKLITSNFERDFSDAESSNGTNYNNLTPPGPIASTRKKTKGEEER